MLALTRRVLSLDQRNSRAWFLQAVMAARAGRFDLARSLLARTSGRLDGEPAVMLLRGLIDLHDGAHEQAIDRLSDLIDQQPANLVARKLLGAAYAQAKDHDGVIQTLRGLAGREDADSYTLTLFGRALEARGDRDAAAAMLDRAASPQMRPSLTLVTVPLGKAVADNAGNPFDARTAIPLIAAQIGAGKVGLPEIGAGHVRKDELSGFSVDEADAISKQSCSKDAENEEFEARLVRSHVVPQVGNEDVEAKGGKLQRHEE